MPNYTLPPIKDNYANDLDMAVDESREGEVYPGRWERRITVPINTDILQTLSVGEDCEITLRGRVGELSNTQSDDVARTSLVLELAEVSAYQHDEKSDFEEGFNRKRKPRRNHY